jgi:hypothetical protein
MDKAAHERPGGQDDRLPAKNNTLSGFDASDAVSLQQQPGNRSLLDV